MAEDVIAKALREAAMLDAVTALEIAAESPTANRCQAFVRAFIGEEQWAVDDVARRRAAAAAVTRAASEDKP